MDPRRLLPRLTRRRLLLAAMGCGLTVLVPAQSKRAERDVLDSMRREACRDFHQPPSAAELRSAEDLFARLLAGERGGAALQPLLDATGFELIAVAAAGEELHVLREIPGRREGRGLFAFRRPPADPVVLQAPHADDDLHTGAIAGLLFLESRAAAVAWSTAPRHAVLRPGEPPADMAHQEESLFQAFTRAFSRALPGGACVQLHGFAAGERRTAQTAAADVIISAGTANPPASLAAAAAKLQGIGSVLLYPRDCQELGGTTNAQGALLRSLGHRGFIHLEMGLELRRRLKAAKDARAALWAGLEAATRERKERQ